MNFVEQKHAGILSRFFDFILKTSYIVSSFPCYPCTFWKVYHGTLNWKFGRCSVFYRLSSGHVQVPIWQVKAVASKRQVWRGRSKSIAREEPVLLREFRDWDVLPSMVELGRMSLFLPQKLPYSCWKHPRCGWILCINSKNTIKSPKRKG